MTRDGWRERWQGSLVPSVLPTSGALPTTVRVLAGASLRLLVRADEAAVRAAGSTDRLRAVVAELPRPRRAYDEL